MQNVIYVGDTLKNVSELKESDKQTVAERLVSQEIHYCVSSMVSELSQDPNGTYIDSILEFSSTQDALDPQDAANNDDWFNYEQLLRHEYYDLDDLKIMLIDAELEYEDRQNFYYQVSVSGIININDCCDDWVELCDYENISLESDDYIEALEHWIVSDRLARKLEEKEELVTFDFLGLTIWGRTCSGQAICLDNVIQDIAIESYSFEQEQGE